MRAERLDEAALAHAWWPGESDSERVRAVCVLLLSVLSVLYVLMLLMLLMLLLVVMLVRCGSRLQNVGEDLLPSVVVVALRGFDWG